MGIPGRSSSGRPNSSAAARLAVSTRRSTPVTTTASARAATISAATRAGSNAGRFGAALGAGAEGPSPRVGEARRLLLMSRKMPPWIPSSSRGSSAPRPHGLRRLAALDAVLDDLERLDRVLVVVLGVLFEPPAPARADLRVLRQAPQRLLGDLLRHALYRIVRRGHGGAELGTAAHLREIRVELLHLRDHWLRY